MRFDREKQNILMWIVVLGCCLALFAGTKVHAQAKYTDAEMLAAIWETTPEAVKGLLPPPLEPYKRPLVLAFIADFPKTSFGVVYKMAALMIACEYDGELGMYCVGMPENEDLPVFTGREILGFPKKMATLSFKREGDTIDAWVERKGIRLFELHATMNRKPDFGEHEQVVREIFPNNFADDAVAFNIKAFLAPDHRGFDYKPRLIRQVTQFRPYQVERCDTEVITRKSRYDSPWGKLKVVKVLGSAYTKGNNTMLPGKVVGEVEPKDYMPFARMKYDW
jgi:acetoacetate decarboxylase